MESFQIPMIGFLRLLQEEICKLKALKKDLSQGPAKSSFEFHDRKIPIIFNILFNILYNLLIITDLLYF